MIIIPQPVNPLMVGMEKMASETRKQVEASRAKYRLWRLADAGDPTERWVIDSYGDDFEFIHKRTEALWSESPSKCLFRFEFCGSFD